MHTASRGGGDGGGGGGGGDDDDGARQARRCVWRCATGTHGYLLAETRPPCSRRRCWSICTGGKSSTWSLVIHGSLQPSTHSASIGSTPESQHAFGSGGSTGQFDSRQQRPPAVKLASIAGGPIPTPLTSHMRWAAGLTKVHATHASVLRQSASQPPAPPKTGWQAPRWLSRLSHVHGSPFTAGSVRFGARHDADDALRARRSSQLGGGRPSIEAVMSSRFQAAQRLQVRSSSHQRRAPQSACAAQACRLCAAIIVGARQQRRVELALAQKAEISALP